MSTYLKHNNKGYMRYDSEFSFRGTWLSELKCLQWQFGKNKASSLNEDTTLKLEDNKLSTSNCKKADIIFFFWEDNKWGSFSKEVLFNSIKTTQNVQNIGERKYHTTPPPNKKMILDREPIT